VLTSAGFSFLRWSDMNAISPQNSAVVPDGTEAVDFLLNWTARWQQDWYLNLCAIPASGGPPTGRSWRVGDATATPMTRRSNDPMNRARQSVSSTAWPIFCASGC